MALLVSDGILVRRLAGAGVGHVADPAIVIAYLAAGCGLAGSGIAYLTSGVRWERKASAAVFVIAVVATTLWLFLHLGGFIYSHSSMFAGKQPAMAELPRVGR